MMEARTRCADCGAKIPIRWVGVQASRIWEICDECAERDQIEDCLFGLDRDGALSRWFERVVG